MLRNRSIDYWLEGFYFYNIQTAQLHCKLERRKAFFYMKYSLDNYTRVLPSFLPVSSELIKLRKWRKDFPRCQVTSK